MRAGCRCVVLLTAIITLLTSYRVGSAASQQVAFAGHRPRFLLAGAPGAGPVEVDAGRSPELRRVVALDMQQPTVRTLLTAIERQAGLKFVFNVARLPDRPVELQARKITVAAALTAILLDTGLDVLLSSGNHVVLVERTPSAFPVGAVVGRVTDAKTGLAVVGAEVVIARTPWRTTTDTVGWYRLTNVDTGTYTLIVRRFGYGKQSRAITIHDQGTDTVSVALDPLVMRLDELVSTATGTRRRRDVPNDITVLNADSLMRTQPVKSVTDLLEGRVPGLLVQHTSGAPGDPSRLRLRGASSPLLSNDPIVIVDGIRVYAEQSAERSANLANLAGVIGSGWQNRPDTLAATYATPSPLDYIDPNSIETIEVVKGPSATTLYGQDAANGVIVITTKKGHAGPTRWTMSAEQGRRAIVARYPERLMRWGHLLYEADFPVICPVGNIYAYPNFPCAGDSIVHFQLLNDPALTPLAHGQRTAASLGVSGGVRSLTYSVTGHYSADQGLLQLPAIEADRYTARLGQAPPDWMRRPQHFTQWGVASQLTAQLGPTADLAFRASLAQSDQQRSALERQLGDLGTIYFDRGNGTYYSVDGIGDVDPGYDGQLGGTIKHRDHLVDDYYTKITAAATQLTTGMSLNWRPWAWLTTTADAGIDVIQRVDGLFLPRGPAIGGDSVGILSDGHGRSVVQTLNLRTTALRPLGGGFTLRLSTGANYTSTAIRDFAAQTRNLPQGQEVPGDTVKGLIQNASDLATFGWFVEPAVDRGRFSLISGLRLDGGSSYGGRLSLPTFPKLGGSWLLSDEPFFPLKSLVSSFRLRAAYGRASRQPGSTDRLRLYGATDFVPVDGSDQVVTALASLGNTKLRPERTGELEGGFDADLWDSRISVSLTGYRKTTDDALLSIPLPPSVGQVSQVTGNIGTTRNTGLDVTLGAQLVRSGPVTWTTNLLVSHRRDEVVRLGPGVTPFYINGGDQNLVGGQRVAPGYPLFGFWAKPVIGYSDLNGDGLITPGEVVFGDTAVYRGAALPDYTATLSSSIGLWHGAVQLTANLLYDKGMTQHLSDQLVQRQVGLSAGRNDPASSLAEQALVASTFVPFGGFLPDNTGTNYYWYQQVSTTRLNAVSVSYTVPSTLARRLGAERLSLAVQGSNLGVWSNYRGVDPNVNGYATGNLTVDAGQLPLPRIWQIRVNATY